MAALLEVRGFTVDLPTQAGWVKPVNDVSLSLNEGETLGVVGESGSGKTMLVLALMGLEPPGARRSGEAWLRLLIADEPTTALDVTVQKQILDLLARLRDELDLALLFITHDLGVVAQVADRLAVLYAGRVVEEGPAEEVLRQPRHPYTEGLLRAAPRLRRGKLEPISGAVPRLDALPPGCAFAPRCPYRRDECDAAVPEMRAASPVHRARCILIP